ncbi:5-methyltetrahydropteroyltriglutamate--homocysteine methyltransferase [Herbaspirillum sp. Sphag1AN]|uniref:5-methyltetrahydropteroyltriglutamate-- homocysteine S-methyltransferase n=1 Tax=unclassified Herbaspirillum TaxID=2624150 RepID=UPI00160D8E44|nr:MULTISPECIES: 5-methyltetrahydropteroyltriglutamate--homocysteine S-methyltransferase [unclassified Herbaspirillum]MBB3212389.1 5-methyltetrahydropteroyltriglutamate--homocysteine methyltransferase [Herbaspirillum sp. Sphag1AN]MBB3245512.1 5-methyltetrahydropteroyltriglutamate--homocysteine methyltransferase [Herbaspirillum sp. Sphag64]
MALKDQGQIAHVLGFPRIGAQRELPQAWQAFCDGDSDLAAVKASGATLRARHWQWQAEAGLDFVCVGDFAWYDQVLNTLTLLGALPTRFGLDPSTLDLYGCRHLVEGEEHQPAMQLRSWFDTNTCYLQPEWTSDVRFDGGVDWLFDEVQEAQQQGYRPKVVLIGPLTLLWLGKTCGDLDNALDLLPQAIAGYVSVLGRLRTQGVELVQLDEPVLAAGLPSSWRDALTTAYATLAAVAPELLLTTYFGAVDTEMSLLASLPVAGIHIDGVTEAKQLAAFAAVWPQDKVLSVGMIDGRNIWRCDLDAALTALQPLSMRLGQRLWLASSCSLLHVPVDVTTEGKLDAELRSWLAFARQKLDEVHCLRQLLQFGAAAETATTTLMASRAALVARKKSPRIRNALVQRRLAQLGTDDTRRTASSATRSALQQARWTSAISNDIEVAPQHRAAIQALRAAHLASEIGFVEYLERLREAITEEMGRQEAAGQDYLVQSATLGQDGVSYFAQQLWGFAITSNGWVQQHGSNCLKPPLVYGDVYRPEAICVPSMQFAQSLTHKPVKVVLCGPLQLLQGAFVRDDLPRATIALQIALALRDELADLERAGIGMICVAEPQLVQGIPSAPTPREDYLMWAQQALNLCIAGVRDMTQMHLHLGMAEDQTINASLAALEVDLLTLGG